VNARTQIGPTPNAREASRCDARAAASRGESAGAGPMVCGQSRPAARAQRRSVCHPPAAAAPITRHGLTRRRTEAAVSPCDQSASASAMAAPENSRRRTNPRGPTAMVAEQARHRYRRSPISSSVAGPLTSAGPRT